MVAQVVREMAKITIELRYFYPKLSLRKIRQLSNTHMLNTSAFHENHVKIAVCSCTYNCDTFVATAFVSPYFLDCNLCSCRKNALYSLFLFKLVLDVICKFVCLSCSSWRDKHGVFWAVCLSFANHLILANLCLLIIIKSLLCQLPKINYKKKNKFGFVKWYKELLKNFHFSTGHTLGTELK